MSDNIWDRFDWGRGTSATSNTATDYRRYYENHYHDAERRAEYHRLIEKERMYEARLEMKSRLLERMKDFVPPSSYMKEVMGDFEMQHEQKDVKEPQTIFHFDPKGIVDKW